MRAAGGGVKGLWRGGAWWVPAALALRRAARSGPRRRGPGAARAAGVRLRRGRGWWRRRRSGGGRWAGWSLFRRPAGWTATAAQWTPRAVLHHSVGKDKDLPKVVLQSFECLPGRGVFATLSITKASNNENKLSTAAIGSVEYISSLYRSNGECEQVQEAIKSSAYGPEFVQAALLVDKKMTLFHFEDELRPGACEVISTLRENAKLRIMMLTGDHESSALRVAKAVCIDEVHCCLKPEDKLNKVKAVSRRGGSLIMIGDGINDAPALAAATVGVVLAQSASATAVAAADVLLLQDNICGVPFCIAKSRQTTLLVKQSVGLALTCILFAALSSVLGFLPLWLTVLVHEGGTLLVCLNSLRALSAPTWSLADEIRQLVDDLRKYISAKLNSSSNYAANTVPL